MKRRASPLEGKTINGEPDAGDPPVRFGGRGRRLSLTPIMACGADPGKSVGDRAALTLTTYRKRALANDSLISPLAQI
jgi:hypothetical protein